MNIIFSPSDSNTTTSIYEPVVAPREIDWSVTGPVMTECLKDLENIQELQEETDRLTYRLKQLILEKSKDQCKPKSVCLNYYFNFKFNY